jgi:hypothetical protein
MSDPEKSGEPTPAPATAETAGATPSVAPASASQPFGLPAEASAKVGTFGSTRGSGLMRGKRPTPPAASAATPAAPGGYKPSSLEVITSKSEYVNPFTGETTVSAPVINEPAPQAAPAPTPAPHEPVAPIAPAPAVATATESAPVAPPAAVTGELFPFNPPASSVPKTAPAVDSSPKPELKILPPEQPRRPAVSWEASPGASGEPATQPQRRDDRATFRTEQSRREASGGQPFEPREPRRDDRKFEPRANQPYQPRDDRPGREDRPERSEPEAPKKSGGFLGWLKGLFGGSAAPVAPAAGGPTGGGEPRRDFDRGGHRRHRGGRGRGGFRGDNRGPRDGQQQPRDPRDGGGEPRPGEPRGEGDFGGRRRRRGGRGRFHGEGGDRGDRGPNPEGQQGGGAI